MNHSHSLGKTERLKHRKLIQQLFSTGNTFVSYPFKVVWKPLPDLPMPVQAVFAVSKRSFKSAVKRNRMRRLMKESYRLHKSGLYKCLTSNNKSLLLALIYLGSELPEYNETEAKIILILRRLTEENENAAR